MIRLTKDIKIKLKEVSNELPDEKVKKMRGLIMKGYSWEEAEAKVSKR